jgi:Hypothetical glycosyl hydrolase family 15
LSLLSSWRRARRLAVPALLCAGSLSAVAAPAAMATDAGSVRFMRGAEANFDSFTRSPTATQQTWMRDHYSRMRTYAPYFDTRLSWYPSGAWFYKDSYAIYRGDESHPEWILKDVHGNRLSIPWGCSGGTCPQYAADIGNPAYRANWIAAARKTMAAGYHGIYVDDVNMQRKIGTATTASVDPIDPRTGTVLTEAMWQRYMADFMAEIRAAFPTQEIVHNAIWFTRDSPDVQRELKSADVIALERGFNDSGITNGTGRWAIQTLMNFIESRQKEGHGVLLDSYATTTATRLYGLAAYYMISSGRDLIGNTAGGTPADWWSGYDVELGAPAGPRYVWNGLWRRDFAKGVALLNEPRNATRSVTLPAGLRDLTGAAKSSLSLAGGTGAVLLKSGGVVPPPVAAPAAAPAPQPAAAPTAAVVRPAVAPPTTSTASSAVPPVAAPRAARVVLRLRVQPIARHGASRVAVRVSGVVRGAAAGHVTLAARGAGSARRSSVRIGRGGRFSRTLRLTHGRWRVKAAYRPHRSAPVTASAARSLSVPR